MLNRPSIFTLAAAALGFVVWLQPDILNGRAGKGEAGEPARTDASRLLAAMPPLPSAETVGAAARMVAQLTTPETAPKADQGQAERTQRLEERERALERREALLKAAEQRLADKINELKLLQSSLDRPAKPGEAAAKPADAEREEQLRRLARVYEDMRPREAARIFEQMDQALLIDVAGRMKPFKLAPVLGAMDPKKANQLTAELAKRRPAPRPVSTQGAGG
jgi:flagellar motility protein MotE (MotC chaperone)